jgi:hypothetical protein
MQYFFGFLFLMFSTCAHAETETIQINTWLYNIPCHLVSGGGSSPDGRTSGQQVLFLENYVNGLLPNPLRISRVKSWIEPVGNSGPIDATTIGNIGVMIDPQQYYTKKSTFPIGQLVTNNWTKELQALEMVLGGSRQKEGVTYAAPMMYRSGDIIAVAPECQGGGSVNLIYEFKVLSDTGDIDPSVIPSTWTQWPATPVQFTPANTDVSNTPFSARILVPGFATASTKIRPHLFWPIAPSPVPSTISHISVCLQDATTPSSCQAAPVEIKCNTQSGIYMFASFDIWCDWTNFSIPAGQNALITISRFAGVNANWAYATSGFAFEWGATGDSWNTLALQGTVVGSHSGWTVAVDKVQVQQ